ncbi:D-amino-acid transaminase [Sporosarcina sp. HYO08]|uniref:D-amino-acid transaminase n=1 Tax=Sporosarcina sp. HYO08 TaxID=1759557 RepID=UPI00079713C4|nr:D-amino-acid transaminase [Sporosarcina sp. HYO08]KXH84079.1 amino acid aminotransferase [Sporosarcina sp. HYO08]
MVIGYFNGEFIPVEQAVIPIDERGHQFGDGVYEVIRVYNGKPFMLDEHIERLIKSGEAIKLRMEKTAEELQQIIHEAVQKSQLNNCDVYIQVTRGIATRKHLFPDAPVSITMTVRPMQVTEETEREKGKTAIFHEDERWTNCYIKSLNLLPNILAKQTAQEAGCYEAILVKDGFVTEGTSSNVYLVKDDSIYTTPLSKQILPGITRMAVKECAEKLGIPFIEKHFTPDELLQADEVFITSTTNEIMPIVRIDESVIQDGSAGKLTTALFEKFKESIDIVQPI